MRRTLLVLLVSCALLLPSCSPASSTDLAPGAPQLVFLHTEASGGLQLVSQATLHSPSSILPFHLPANCPVYKLYPNPVAALLAVEFECGGGPAVLVYNLQSGETFNPAETLQADARFLAWSVDGHSLYLKTDSLGNPQILRFDHTRNRLVTLSLPGTIYDLVALPDGRIVYSLSRGLGFGSETWLADADGHHARQILAEPLDIAAYLRPSPDGNQIAYILMPDSQTPFTVGELWMMSADGKNPHALAEADAGHGYAPAWSPDGMQIAFVVRENSNDPQADQSAGALISNIYRIKVQDGTLVPVTSLSDAIVGAPVWSPDSTALFFNVTRNDTIQIWFNDAGALQPLSEEDACCAVWVPGR